MRTHALTLSTALCSLQHCCPAHVSRATTCGERRASRRHWLQTAAFGAGIGRGAAAHWTRSPRRAEIHRLGAARLGDRNLGGAKRICLSEVPPECLPLLAELARDIEKGATGKGGYPISGDLTPEIFRDDCRFVDPTNDVTSSRYRKALTILFDPNESTYINKRPRRRRGQARRSRRRWSVARCSCPGGRDRPWESHRVEGRRRWLIERSRAQTLSTTALNVLIQDNFAI